MWSIYWPKIWCISINRFYFCNKNLWRTYPDMYAADKAVVGLIMTESELQSRSKSGPLQPHSKRDTKSIHYNIQRTSASPTRKLGHTTVLVSSQRGFGFYNHTVWSVLHLYRVHPYAFRLFNLFIIRFC